MSRSWFRLFGWIWRNGMIGIFVIASLVTDFDRFKQRCGRGVNGSFLWATQRFKVCSFGNLGTTRQLASLISSGHLAAIVPNYFARSLEIEMDKDRVSGAAKQVTGSVKEAAGKLTGDSKMQSEGKADKVVGKVQNSIGGAKDAVREAIDGKKR